MDIDRIIKQVEEETKIPTSARSFNRVMSAVITASNFWDIVYYSDEPLPLVASMLKLLAEEGYIELSDEAIRLTEKGEALCKRLNISGRYTHRCPRCRGRGIVIDEFDDAFKKFVEIQKSRPEAIRQYDQGYVTPETTFSRIALADSRGDVRGKDIMILGDDDLVSIAFALTGLPSKVTVVDIDQRIIGFIKDVAQKEGLNIDARVCDLRKPLPEDVIGKYDVFFTDPSETLGAIEAFIGRGLLTLKGIGCSGYFGITNVESSFYKRRKIQQILFEKGVVITDIIYNFNEYVNWGYTEQMRAWELSPVKHYPLRNWYYSSIYRIEVVEPVKIENEDLTNKDIYNDNESSTV